MMFLLVFAGLVPLVYADHRRVNDRTPIVVWRLALIGTSFASIPSVLVGATTGVRGILYVAGPVIALAAVGMLALTWIANRELTR
jgi:hypothetical protein